MLIKNSDSKLKCISHFDLLGTKETALCKALAYTISKDTDVFLDILSTLFNIRRDNKNFISSSIQIEKAYKSGRTDIEIKFNKDDKTYHIIFECKVKRNTVGAIQNGKYVGCFDKNTHKKILCFLTQDVPSNRIIPEAKDNNIDIKYYNWSNILSIMESIQKKSETVQDFINYFNKGYKMKTFKEILVQDLGDNNEINRLAKNFIYRRDSITGTPLYFAPYFTKKQSTETEGLNRIYDIVGVITGTAADILANIEQINGFAEMHSEEKEEQKKRIEIWKSGIEIDSKDEKEHTYYFLGTPQSLGKSLLKDGGTEKGRGKNWIAAMIPKNRCITFKDLLAQMNKPEQK